jgi:hypothetical protein
MSNVTLDSAEKPPLTGDCNGGESPALPEASQTPYVYSEVFDLKPSRVFQVALGMGKTTGRFEVEDFAVHIPYLTGKPAVQGETQMGCLPVRLQICLGL